MHIHYCYLAENASISGNNVIRIVTCKLITGDPERFLPLANHMKAYKSVHVTATGTATDLDGKGATNAKPQPFSMDVSGPVDNISEQLAMTNGTEQISAVQTTTASYVKANHAFWQAQVGSGSSSKVALLADRWIKVPGSLTMLPSNLTLKSLTSDFTDSFSTPNLAFTNPKTTVTSGTVGKTPTWVLTAPDKSVVWIGKDSGDILQYHGVSDGKDDINLSNMQIVDHDKNNTITAPSGAIDASHGLG